MPVSALKPSEQERFLRLVLDSTTEGFYSIDTEGHTTLCNAAFLRMLGYGSASEVIGRKLHGEIHHMHPDGSAYPVSDCPIYNAAANGKSARVTDELFFRRDGTSFPVDYRAEPIWRDGTLVGAVCTFTDISERLAQEKAFAETSLIAREALERIDLALNSGAVLATWVWDVAHDKVVGDERFARTFSVPSDQAAQGLPLATVVQAIHPDDIERVLTAINGALEDKGSFRSEYRLTQPDGSWRWVEANGRAEKGEDGKVARFPGVIIDIDDRKHSELALLKSNQQLQMAQEAGGIGIFSLDIADDMMTVTPAFCRIFGLEEKAHFAAKFVESILVPDDGAIATNMETRAKGSATLDVEYRIRRPDTGEIRWIGRKAAFISGSDGKPAQLVGVVQDITGRKQGEAALKESEAQFRLLAQAMPNQVWSAQPDGGLDWFNETVYDYSGLSYDALAGVNWAQIVHPDDLADVAAAWQKSLEAGEPYETQFRIRRHDGVYRWHIVRAVPFRNDGTILRWIGTNTDIEDQVSAAQSVNDAHAHLSLMVESAADYAIISIDKDGLISSWSSGAERIFGYSPDETIGQPIAMIFTEEDRAAGVPAYELTVAAKAGRANDERWHLRKNEERFYVSGIMAAMYDDQKHIRGFIKIARDMTEQRRTQEALIEARNAAEAANIAKTEFLANMSHEIRTPMNAVIGLSNILATSQPLTQKQKEFIHTLQMSADSLLALINDLLDIAKIEARTVDLEHVPFSLTQVMQEVISMMGVRVREKGLAFTGDGECVERRMFMGDPTRLRQIILNLCSNAVKFTHQGGVHISINCYPADTANTENVYLSVKDTGIGIAPEKLESIFQKFVQADSSISRKYGGTGLGLAITKTLAELMGGTLSVESTPGKGSVFTVCVPLEIASNAEVQESDYSLPELFEPVLAGQKSPRVLLVEDYAPNVLVATTFLESFGYAWDVATNGMEAIERIRDNSYVVALMDVQMHGMNGLEATTLIREAEKKNGSPRLPIIGMTAHALTGDRERCLAAGMDDYIAKPFNPEELKEKLAQYRT